MFIGNAFDWLLIATLAICVAVWPTQIITDEQNRWLRIVAVGLCILQLILDGPRVQLLPAYFVVVIFIWRLIPRSRHTPQVPSAPESIKARVARWLMVTGTASALLVSAVLCLVFPRYEYPKPSGPFGVGVREFRLTDVARFEAATHAPDDHREVLVRASYPTAIEDKASQHERDTVPDRAVIAVRYAFVFLGPGRGVIPQSWGRVRTNAWREAPLAAHTNRFPVLIYSHGLGSWPEQNTALIEELASHGYIVLALNHAGLSAGFELSNGATIGLEAYLDRARTASRTDQENDRQRQRGRELTSKLMDASLPVDARMQVLKERAALFPQEVSAAAHRLVSDDQRFVLASLEALQTDDPVLRGHMGLERIGVFGMSSGGTASNITCVADRRCRAGVNMDGFQALLVEIAPLAVPFMHMSNERHHNHIIPHKQSTADSYLVRVKGSAHGSFTDMPYTTPLLQQLDEHGIPMFGTIEGQRMLQVMHSYVLAFFDKHLKGQVEPLLDGASDEFPEVEFLSNATPP